MNEVVPNQQNLIIYNTLDGKVSVTMMARDGNVWMNQKQMAELFATSVPNVNIHISNILKEDELNRDSVIKDFLITAGTSNREPKMILKGNKQKHITMKTTRLYTLFALLMVLAFSSCTAKKGFVTKLPKQEIADVQRFPIISDIYALDKNDNGYRSDSLSLLSVQCVNNYLDRQTNIDITKNIEVNDTTLLRMVSDEIRGLSETAFDNKEIALIPIPHTIDSLLEVQGKRFGLLIYANGFERYEKNRLKAFNQALIMMQGGATLNPYYDYFSTISLFIVDSSNNNIAFYNHSKIEERPSRQYCIDRHFMELYYRYWR